MESSRRLVLLRAGMQLAVLAFLVLASVLVFMAFDSRSHSASDTLRPAFLTLAPLWAVGAWALWKAGRVGRPVQ